MTGSQRKKGLEKLIAKVGLRKTARVQTLLLRHNVILLFLGLPSTSEMDSQVAKPPVKGKLLIYQVCFEV